MRCKLCGSNRLHITYKGKIRNGGLGKYTREDIEIYKCENCDVIWHDAVIDDLEQYYESSEYRDSLEGSSEADIFYKLHDKETLNKFLYTGTDIFRHKVVADIGCGCGAFLDFLKGVASEIVAVEPSETYRQVMDKKGFHTYAYAEEAKLDWENKIDRITSFDVIEHVEDPMGFLKECYYLLKEGGQAVIGTPTDAPVMRSLLGETYEKQLLFSTQHLWIFSEKTLKMMAESAGYQEISVKYFQRYGIQNLLGWLKEKRPNADLHETWVADALDRVWKAEAESQRMSDYIVLFLKK